MEKQRNNKTEIFLPDSAFGCLDDAGVHPLFPGKQPAPELLQLLAEPFQRQLLNSPLSDEMVTEFGEQEAEELRKQCRAKFGHKITVRMKTHRAGRSARLHLTCV